MLRLVVRSARVMSGRRAWKAAWDPVEVSGGNLGHRQAHLERGTNTAFAAGLC